MKGKEQNATGQPQADKTTAQAESLNLEVEVLEERIAPMAGVRKR